MKKINEEILGEGNWLTLKRSSFVDDQGQNFCWEHIARKGSKQAVIIFAIIEPMQDVLLIRQFRAGANCHVLSLPAGMMEPDATDAGAEALRELLEETGYTGTVVEVGPIVSSFPALSDATVQLVRVSIDGTAPENLNPVQHLEPGEIIQTLRVPLKEIREFLKQEAASGTQVVSGLWYLFALQS